MNELKVFTHNTYGEVRTVMQDGEPWFVAADVCKALEIEPTATRRLDDDEKSPLRLTQTSSNGVEQGRDVTIINEPGLYSLVLGSRKPEAKAFKRWITHEVIPSIRKHGGYMTPDTIEQVLSDPDTIIRLATELKNEKLKNQKLETLNSQLTVYNQIMKPKADYFDELVDRNLLTNFRTTAKELKVGERHFISFLLQRKYVYRDKKGQLCPHATHLQNGLFEVKETYNEKTDWRGTQTMITPKGRETFRLLMLGGAA